VWEDNITMNYPKILTTTICILVATTLLTALYCFATFWGGYNILVISGGQLMILAFGLSAIALAVLRTSYRED